MYKMKNLLINFIYTVHENKHPRMNEESKEDVIITIRQKETSTFLQQKSDNYKCRRNIKKNINLQMEFRVNKEELSYSELCKKKRTSESTFCVFIIKKI